MARAGHRHSARERRGGSRITPCQTHDGQDRAVGHLVLSAAGVRDQRHLAGEGARPMIVAFEAELWIWDARRDDSWTFVSLPVEASQEIREVTEGPRRGFG